MLDLHELALSVTPPAGKTLQTVNVLQELVLSVRPLQHVSVLQELALSVRPPEAKTLQPVSVL